MTGLTLETSVTNKENINIRSHFALSSHMFTFTYRREDESLSSSTSDLSYVITHCCVPASSSYCTNSAPHTHTHGNQSINQSNPHKAAHGLKAKHGPGEAHPSATSRVANPALYDTFSESRVNESATVNQWIWMTATQTQSHSPSPTVFTKRHISVLLQVIFEGHWHWNWQTDTHVACMCVMCSIYKYSCIIKQQTGGWPVRGFVPVCGFARIWLTDWLTGGVSVRAGILVRISQYVSRR